MLSQIFIPSNKWNLETSSHFLVTQDQNPSSSNHKSLVTVTVRHLECLGIIFFLLIRNSLDAVLKVSQEPYSTLLPLAANTWHVIWPSVAFLKPGFKETDNSSIGWLSITQDSILKEKRHHTEHLSHGENKLLQRSTSLSLHKSKFTLRQRRWCNIL